MRIVRNLVKRDKVARHKGELGRHLDPKKALSVTRNLLEQNTTGAPRGVKDNQGNLVTNPHQLANLFLDHYNGKIVDLKNRRTPSQAPSQET